VNSTDQGGDKAAWYTEMFQSELPRDFPQVKAVVIFNENRASQEKVNWSINVTPESLKSFKEAVSSL
jgi:hypothetical protein